MEIKGNLIKKERQVDYCLIKTIGMLSIWKQGGCQVIKPTIRKQMMFYYHVEYFHSSSNFRLIECEQLNTILQDGNKEGIRILHPYSSENRSNYMKEMVNFIQMGHIEGSHFVNMHDLSDLSSAYDNRVPSNEQFSYYMQRARISKKDTLLICDESILLSTRLHWLFDAFGHTNLYLLNGGIRRWKQLQLPLQKGISQSKMIKIPQSQLIDYDYEFNHAMSIQFDEISKINDNYKHLSSEYQIIDSRRPSQYIEGQEPHWTHVPAMDVFFQSDGRFQDIHRLTQLCQEYEIDFNKTLIQTCRKGLQATAANFACHLVCQSLNLNCKSKIYDGSWEEWMLKRSE